MTGESSNIHSKQQVYLCFFILPQLIANIPHSKNDILISLVGMEWKFS
jgi:hypothetical protein